MPSLQQKYLLLLAEHWPAAGVESILLYMDFTTAHAAPLTSPHTAALDGSAKSKGQLVLTQTDGEYSTSGGSLVIPAQATPNWGDQGWIGYADEALNGFARAAGLALTWKMTKTANGSILIGFGDSSAVSFTALDGYSAFYPGSANNLRLVSDTGFAEQVGVLTTGVEYTYSVIVRDTGYFFAFNGELVYIVDSGTLATLYPTLANFITLTATMPTAALAQLNTSLANYYPRPLLADDFTDVPTIEDKGGNGIDATANYVGLGTAAGADGYLFDGSKSYIQLDAAALETAGWDDATGMVICEFTPIMSSRTGWIATIGNNTDNTVSILQSGTTLSAFYKAGGVTEERTLIASVVVGTTYRVGVAWTGGSVRFYIDGAESGSAQTIDGIWAGTLTNAYSILGALQNTPIVLFPGTVSAFALTLNTAISDADMLSLTNQTTNPTLTPALMTAATGGDSTKWAGYFGEERYASDGAGHVEGQREGQAATAQVSGALDADALAGVYHNVPLADGGGGRFNGLDGYVQLDAAALETAGWDDATGAIICEVALGSSATQFIFRVGAIDTSSVYVYYSLGDLYLNYRAGGTIESRQLNVSIGTTCRIGIAWSGGSVRFYVDGTEQGTAQVIAGTWAGTLLDLWCVIGAANNTPSNELFGTVSAFALTLNAAISDADMQALTNQTTTPTLTPTLLDAAAGAGKYVLYDLDDPPVGASLGDGIAHVSGNWSQAGGVLVNSPTPGAELLTNPGGPFTFTADNPDGWGVTGESGTDPQVSEVATGESHADAPTVGGGQVNIYTSDGTFVQILQTDVLTAGLFYKIVIDIDNVVAGAVAISDYFVGVPAFSTDIMVTSRASNTPFNIKRSSGATDVTIASASVKQLSFAQLLTGATTITEDYPRWQVLLDPDDGYQCGFAVFLDDPTNPTVGLIPYWDTNDNKIKFWDIGAGTELSATAITPSAGAQLQGGYLSDGKLYWTYNNTTSGNVAYTPTAGALYCALFDTGSPTGAITQAALWQGDQCTGLAGVI